MIALCQQLILIFFIFFYQKLLLSQQLYCEQLFGVRAGRRNSLLCVSTNNCEYSGLGWDSRSPIHPDPIRTITRTRCWKPNSSPMEARSTSDPIPISCATPNNYTYSDPDPMVSSPVLWKLFGDPAYGLAKCRPIYTHI